MFRKKYSTNFYKKQRLLMEINQSKQALDTAYSKFANVTDQDLIDSSIYELNACQTRYKYLLECAKEYDMTCLYNQVLS